MIVFRESSTAHQFDERDPDQTATDEQEDEPISVAELAVIGEDDLRIVREPSVFGCVGGDES